MLPRLSTKAKFVYERFGNFIATFCFHENIMSVVCVHWRQNIFVNVIDFSSFAKAEYSFDPIVKSRVMSWGYHFRHRARYPKLCDQWNESHWAVLQCQWCCLLCCTTWFNNAMALFVCLFVLMFFFLVKFEWIVWKVMKVRDDVSLYVTIQFNKLLKLENTQCAITTLFRHDSERWWRHAISRCCVCKDTHLILREWQKSGQHTGSFASSINNDNLRQ